MAIKLPKPIDLGIRVGTEGADTLIGNDGNQTFYGYGGNDTIVGAKGNDTIFGGNGNDLVDYSDLDFGIWVRLDRGEVIKYGGGGTDKLDSIERIMGTSHNDRFYGNDGNNKFSGGAGNDYFRSDFGADTYNGGTGVDTVSYSSSNVGVSVTLQNGQSIAYASGGMGDGDRLVSIENLTGSRYDDRLGGNSADNVLNGWSGNDTFIGSEGSDTIIGGSGSDTVDYSGHDFGLRIDLSAGTATGIHVDDTLSSIERVIGTDAEDYFSGTAGNDYFAGREGNDTFYSDLGFDIYFGGSGFDAITYQNSSEGVVINAGLGYGTGGDAEGDLYFEIEQFYGSDFDDTFIAHFEGANFHGGAGADLFFGDDGHDIFNGGYGVDTFNGGAGSDTVDFQYSSSTGVNVDLLNGTAVTSDGIETLTSIENANGSDHDDNLLGSNEDNLLFGGEGDDTLEGLDGNDELYGGRGSDIFKFGNDDGGDDAFGHGQDVIRDFNTLLDAIDLSDSEVRNFDDLFNGGDRYAEQVGDDTVIYTIDGEQGDSITLVGVQVDDLSEANFVF